MIEAIVIDKNRKILATVFISEIDGISVSFDKSATKIEKDTVNTAIETINKETVDESASFEPSAEWNVIETSKFLERALSAFSFDTLFDGSQGFSNGEPFDDAVGSGDKDDYSEAFVTEDFNDVIISIGEAKKKT